MTNHNRTPQTTRKISPLAKALARVIVGSTLGVGTLFSCGMDFPIELLSDRKETLQGMPSGDFFFEAERLIAAKSENFPAAKNYPYQEPPELEDSEVEPELDGSLRSAETAGLSQAQLKQWRLARNTNSAEGVSALAPDLPKASQLYIAGALAFQQGDDVQARDYFQQAAELPERAVWAQFMLGKIAARAGDRAAMRAHFAQTRSAALAGKPDPLGLALASFGEEAQSYWQDFAEAQAPISAEQLQSVNTAVELYAAQAAQTARSAHALRAAEPDPYASDFGANSGAASLLVIARNLNGSPERQQAALTLPLVRKLMISYAFSRGYEALARNEQSYDWPEQDETYRDPDFAAGMAPYFLKPTLISNLQQALGNDTQVDGADRLAAALYRAGEFAASERFAKASESPVAYWVRAKLALRDGDKKTAAQHYQSALAKADPKQSQSENWISDSEGYAPLNQACRIAGEAATLALSQDDVESALSSFFTGGRDYSTDMSYVAERLMDLDKLHAFVKKHTTAQTAKKNQWDESEGDETLEFSRFDEMGKPQLSYPQAVLRQVTARRLMRAQRFEDALSLFDHPAHKRQASAYAQAMQQAAKSQGVEKAAQLFAAAGVARYQGMEILGFELSPDFSNVGGNFGGEFDVEFPPLKPEALKANLFSAQEIALQQSTIATPNRRLHYRYHAVNLANQAADLLPERSQAFAAVLCKATNWVIYRDTAAAGALYSRYLAKGAYVPWGAAFGGSECPSPDFPRAQAMLDQIKWAERKRLLKRSVPYLAGLSLLLIGVGLTLRARARKANTSLPDQ